MTKQLETEITPQLNIFKGMIKDIPDKYLFKALKKNIIKNKECNANRIINATVKYRDQNNENKKHLVYTDKIKPQYP